MFRLKTHVFRLKWPFLVRFGLNLGLNNLKFGQKAISDRIDRIDQKLSPNQTKNGHFKLLRPKLSPNQTKAQKMAIFVTGNGNYNSLFSKIFEIFDYFRTVVPYFEYFRVIFVNLSFAFSSAFVSRVPQSTEPLYIFECKFEYEKKTVSSFAKMENPEKKSFRIALMHCINLKDPGWGQRVIQSYQLDNQATWSSNPQQAWAKQPGKTGETQAKRLFKDTQTGILGSFSFINLSR